MGHSTIHSLWRPVVGVFSCDDDDVYLRFLLTLCKYSTPVHNGDNNVKKKTKYVLHIFLKVGNLSLCVFVLSNHKSVEVNAKYTSNHK